MELDEAANDQVEENYDAWQKSLPLTRDEIAQKCFGVDEFEALADDIQWEAEALYDRQPFAAGISPENVKTRTQIAQDRYGKTFEELSWETCWDDVEPAYAEQFSSRETYWNGDLPRYNRDVIARERFGTPDLSLLSFKQRFEVEELFARQPFVPLDWTEFGTWHCIKGLVSRDDIAQEKFDEDFADLNDHNQLAVEDIYDEQFILPTSGNVRDIDGSLLDDKDAES